MPSKSALFFLSFLLLELYMLVAIGSEIGGVFTILVVIATAIFGIFCVRTQGLLILHNTRKSLERGEIPAFELIEGLIILLCGVLLLIPGFISDTLGLLGLVPPMRAWFLATLGRNLLARFSTYYHQKHGKAEHKNQDVYEGDYKE